MNTDKDARTLKKITLLITLLSVTGVASASDGSQAQFLVPGSMDHDFSVACNDQGKETFSIKPEKNNAYRRARNIVFTNIGGDRVLISLLHGFSAADTQSTYLTSATERCEAFKQ